MTGFRKRLGAAALLVGCAWILPPVAPAFAGADVAWRIDPDTLPPAQRQQALTARLGNTGPFGEPAAPGCIWTRIQVPTMQGLRWIDEENCDNQGSWDW